MTELSESWLSGWRCCRSVVVLYRELRVMNKIALGLVAVLIGTGAYAQSSTTSPTNPSGSSTTSRQTGGGSHSRQTGGGSQTTTSQGGRGGTSVGVESRESGTAVRTRTETSEQPTTVTRRRTTTTAEQPSTEVRRTVKRTKAVARKRGKAKKVVRRGRK